MKLKILPFLLLIPFYGCQPPVSEVEINRQNMEERIDAILQEMSLDEKVEIIGGAGFKTKKNNRLDIPEIIMTDGPLGPNSGGPSTNYSSMINLAASFDTDLMSRVANNIGEETRIKGFNMLLGPCLDIARAPHGGRTFESFGEDPFLASRMTVEFVKGVQSKGVATCAKHFVGNNQEWNRFDVDSRISDRALQEIYFPPFKAAVTEAGGLAIMTAYNQILGDYTSESNTMINDVLKDGWGFTGAVVSDWGASRSLVKMANAGLDLEMPTGKYYNKTMIPSIKSGVISQDNINDKVRRILRVMMKLGLFDSNKNPYENDISNTPERQKLALETAQKSIVLLKNENNFLPLDKTDIKSIAVVGPNGNVAQMHAGGSGALTGHYGISPLGGLKNKLGNDVDIQFERGVAVDSKELPIAGPEYFQLEDGSPGIYAEYFNNKEQEGDPVLTRVEKDINNDWGYGGSRDPNNMGSPDPEIVNMDKWSARWTGKFVSPGEGWYEIGLRSDNGVRMYLDGEKVLDYWIDSKPGQFKIIRFKFEKDHLYDLQVDFYENIGSCRCKLGFAPFNLGNIQDKAISIAKNADVVVMAMGLDMFMEGEAVDRDQLGLPMDQVNLIKAVTKVNPNVVVVLNNATPILMNEWLNEIPAVVDAFYPGQEGGNALADILFGDVNPSGRLPLTFPKKWEDTPVAKTYPGVKAFADYSEGIFMGYRHYDTYDMEPLFPFGHGLSYTQFEYSDLKVYSIKFNRPGRNHRDISVNITNTGQSFGEEVVQVYVSDLESSVEREMKALKGFQRVALNPGESKTITIRLNHDAFTFYHPDQKKWIVEPGEFEILVGSSSRDIRLKTSFNF